MSYHSQYGEDRWILENLRPDPGTFCEVGAFDGVLSSNTYAFEQLGWKGILIEPDLEMAAKARANRKALVWCCAAGQPCNTMFHVNEQDRGTSGLYVPGRPVPVIVVRLESLLIDSQIKALDFLSIDTEGSELEVWGTIGNYRPRIVMMEYWTMPNKPNPKPIQEQMARDGYFEVLRTDANLVFVRQ